jgi:hypothetical protein
MANPSVESANQSGIPARNRRKNRQGGFRIIDNALERMPEQGQLLFENQAVNDCGEASQGQVSALAPLSNE